MAFRKFKDIEYPVPGVDTAIQVLRPGAQYDMISRGDIIWNEWIVHFVCKFVAINLSHMREREIYKNIPLVIKQFWWHSR